MCRLTMYLLHKMISLHRGQLLYMSLIFKVLDVRRFPSASCGSPPITVPGMHKDLLML